MASTTVAQRGGTEQAVGRERRVLKRVRTQTRAAAAAPTAAPSVRQEDAHKEEYVKGQTLNTWLLKQEQVGHIDSELAIVLSSIAVACKTIAGHVHRANITGSTGAAGQGNIQGEEQKKLDVVSNDTFRETLRLSGRTAVMASEEEETPVAVEETYSGEYIAVFDPLDGSSNIDAAISTGSIFGVYKPAENCILPFESTDENEQLESCISNVCQPGSNMLAAGYCMYSSSVEFVLTVGCGVYNFTLDPLIGEFVLTGIDIQIPTKGKTYSFNEGNYDQWPEPLQRYCDRLKNGGPDGGKPYGLRYIGSLVGDFHRTLLYGGIFGYPGDSKNPDGKLRLLYECAPMAYIAEQAKGAGTTGSQRMLDVHPDHYHERTPFYVGSAEEIAYLESHFQ